MNTVEQIADVNPLLDFSGLPRFAEIRPAHVAPAHRCVARRRARDDRARRDRDRTADLGHRSCSRSSDALDRLDRAWTQVGHLNAVVNTPELRDAYNDNLPKVTAFYTDLGAGRAPVRALPRACRLARHSRRSIRPGAAWSTMRCAISGCPARSSPAAPKARFKAIEEELASLSSRFDDNLLDATNAWALYVDDAVAPGRRARRRRRRGARRGASRWQAGLEAHAAHAVLPAGACSTPTIASLRETLYRAYATRASEFGNPEWDNGAAGRHASWSCAAKPPRCSATPATPKCRWCRRWRARRPRCSPSCAISRRARKPFAERDMAELAAFARDELGLPDARRLGPAPTRRRSCAQARYSFSDQEVKQYFPEDHVLSGLFRVVETIYGDHDPRSDGAGVASRRALLRAHRPHRRAGRPVLSRSVRAAGQAGRRVDGRRDQHRRANGQAAASGRLPDLQFLRARRRQAGTVHARRSDHAVPRVRPRPASVADARRRAGRVRPRRASNGTRSSCPASSWRTSAGNGTWSST